MSLVPSVARPSEKHWGFPRKKFGAGGTPPGNEIKNFVGDMFLSNYKRWCLGSTVTLVSDIFDAEGVFFDPEFSLFPPFFWLLSFSADSTACPFTFTLKWWVRREWILSHLLLSLCALLLGNLSRIMGAIVTACWWFLS